MNNTEVHVVGEWPQIDGPQGNAAGLGETHPAP